MATFPDSRRCAATGTALALAVAGCLMLAAEVSAFEVITDPAPDEVQLTPLAAPPYERAPFQFRECHFTVSLFATTSDLSPFIPDELSTVEPPAAPGTTLMLAFGGKCPKTTLGPCAFTLVLAPVRLNLPGHPENGDLVGIFPIHAFVSNENYYKHCDMIGGCPLKLGIVDRQDTGSEVEVVLSRLDIRPVNMDGEFDINGEVATLPSELVRMSVQSLAPVDNAALDQFEQATGLPFRDAQGNLVFPPLVNLKLIPSVEAGLDVAQLTRVPFQAQVPANAMYGPADLELFSTVADPIADNIQVAAIFGGMNFDFEWEFGWPDGDILHDYLAVQEESGSSADGGSGDGGCAIVPAGSSGLAVACGLLPLLGLAAAGRRKTHLRSPANG